MSRLRRSLAFGIVIALVAGLASAQEPRDGIVVIEAPSMSSLAETGLQRGDVLLSWQRSGLWGALRWPSGLAEAETEQAPWGVVRLTGLRGDRPMTWQMPAVRWNVRTRPALSPPLLALYRDGAERAAARDLEGAADAWLRAVDAAARTDDKQRSAWFLGELGRVQATASQWESADQAYEDAIRRAEGSGMAAYLLREWGGTFIQRELWARAESCYQRALALAPRGSLAAGRDLALLASIATHQGDLDRAESLYTQALATRRRVTVSGAYLTRLTREEIAGFGVPDQGVSREEVQELRHKLEGLREKLLALAGVSPAQGAEGLDRTAAAPSKKPEKPSPNPLEVLKQALVKAESEAPGSLAVSDRWQELGELVWTRGDAVAAEVAWLRALDLREKLAPGTLREARTLHDLGRVHAKAKRDRAATGFFCRAAAALDRMDRAPADDTATREALGATPAAYDQDCMAALVEAGRPGEAFQALERSRIRGGALPLAPELARHRKEIDAERTQVLARLGRLSTSRDRDEVDLLAGYTGELSSRRAGIAGPRDLDAVRAALSPGTLLLAWSIGEKRSFLFLVRPAQDPGPGVEAFPVRARAGNLGTADLYRHLFGPADPQIAAAERLLLLPDNVLKALPFGTLVQKPLETAASATAWVAAQKDIKDTKDTARP